MKNDKIMGTRIYGGYIGEWMGGRMDGEKEDG